MCKYFSDFNINLNRISNIQTIDHMDSFVNDLTEATNKTCEASIPLRKHGEKKNPWWNPELETSKKTAADLKRAVGEDMN